MAEAPSFTGEVRMLIDGKLVEADVGRDVRQHQPGHRGGDRPGRRRRRRPTWSRRSPPPAGRSTRPTGRPTTTLRKRCLAAAAGGARGRAGGARARRSSPRSARPVMLTYAAQLDALLDDMQWAIELIDEFEWERELPDGTSSSACATADARSGRSRSASSARSCRGTSRSRSCSTSSARRSPPGNTVVLKPAPDTPWNATRIGRLVAEETDIPAGVLQRRDVVGPPRRRGAHRCRRAST